MKTWQLRVLLALVGLWIGVLCGCGRAPRPIHIMQSTHKVWFDENWLQYENPEGFGCGRVERQARGWIYEATVLNWNGDKGGRDLHNNFNTLIEAEKYVEKWCKP